MKIEILLAYMTGRSQEQEGKHVVEASPVMETRSPPTSKTLKTSSGAASSPASSASTGLGVKRISQPDSPQVSAVEQSSRDKCVGESLLSVAAATKDLTEEEWVRSGGRASEMPPYPLSLVGRVSSLTDKMVTYLHSYFLRRDNPASDNRVENRFRRKNIPSIGLGDYLQRICNYVIALEPPMILAVLAYAHILDPPADESTFCDDGDARNCHEWGDESREHDPKLEKLPLLRIDPFTVHRFVIASITLASKALGDHYYSNAFYAKVGGVSTRELNHLELDLALLLDWRLQVSKDTLQRIWLQLNA